MEEEKKDVLPEGEGKPSYTPATKKKRILAWLGVVFMVLLILAYSYSLATGAFLNW